MWREKAVRRPPSPLPRGLFLRPQANLLRRPVQLEEIEPRAVTVYGEDIAAIVDLQVISHIAVRLGKLIAYRNVIPHFDGPLRLADVPYPHAASEVGKEGQPAIVGIGEILLARMHAETRAAQAVVAARVFLTRTGIYPHRRKNHGALPRILLRVQGRWARGIGLRVFDRHIHDEAPVRRFLAAVG